MDDASADGLLGNDARSASRTGPSFLFHRRVLLPSTRTTESYILRSQAAMTRGSNLTLSAIEDCDAKRPKVVQ